MIGVDVKKIVVLIVVTFVCWFGIADAADAPTEIRQIEMSQHPFDYVPETRKIIPANLKCPQFWNVLSDAGWLKKDVLKADAIIWRESRCNPMAHNKNDPNTVEGVKGSLGLFQINMFWIQKTTYYSDGYLQTVLGRRIAPADFFDVQNSIQFAAALIAYDRANGNCGWSAWIGC